mmetsp:Transcript_61732/g.108459  ORF Transcript_61732/g.108459 Transcript_61732/m.108459 type:complete len:437 (-) Transcript_61732:2451-3761(-)
MILFGLRHFFQRLQRSSSQVCRRSVLVDFLVVIAFVSVLLRLLAAHTLQSGLAEVLVIRFVEQTRRGTGKSLWSPIDEGWLLDSFVGSSGGSHNWRCASRRRVTLDIGGRKALTGQNFIHKFDGALHALHGALDRALVGDAVEVEAHASLVLDVAHSGSLGADDHRDRRSGNNKHLRTSHFRLGRRQEVQYECLSGSDLLFRTVNLDEVSVNVNIGASVGSHLNDVSTLLADKNGQEIRRRRNLPALREQLVDAFLDNGACLLHNLLAGALYVDTGVGRADFNGHFGLFAQRNDGRTTLAHQGSHNGWIDGNRRVAVLPLGDQACNELTSRLQANGASEKHERLNAIHGHEHAELLSFRDETVAKHFANAKSAQLNQSKLSGEILLQQLQQLHLRVLHGIGGALQLHLVGVKMALEGQNHRVLVLQTLETAVGLLL